MKPLKVLVIDSSIEIISRITPKYSEVFRRVGYEPTYFPATSAGEGKKIIDSNWPHVVICDLSLERGSEGLEILRRFKNEYPEIFRILASRSEFSPRTAAAKRADFGIYFDKTELNGENPTYIEAYANSFSELFRVNTKIELDHQEEIYNKGEFSKPGNSREFASLLAQITFTGHDSDTQITPDTVKLSRLSGGFSGSHVFQFNTFNSKSRLASIPGVLKVSQQEWAAAELNNYNKYVKWGLPYTWRVDLLGSGRTKNWGAVAYSFINDDNSKPFNSLTHYLEFGKFEIALNVINKIFSPEMKRWYGDELIEPADNIVRHYLRRYFRDPNAKQKSAEIFKSLCAELYGALPTGTNLKVLNYSIQDPMSKLFGTPMDGYLSCICHGDLNSNNVIVSDSGGVIFIDFQETGRGHVFEDFVTLESSVRLCAASAAICSWDEYLHTEISLDGSKEEVLPPELILIKEIRSLARRNFPNEDFKNYFYACAVFHFRLLRMPLNEVQLRKCACAVIACLTKI